MRWVTYAGGDGERAGLVVDGAIHGLAGGQRLLDLLGDEGQKLSRAAEEAVASPAEVVSLEGASLQAPVPVPPSIRDFMSFEDHVLSSTRASGLEMDPGWYENPVFYFSNPAAVCGPSDPVAVSPGSVEFDFELEIAAIIGLPGSDIAPEEAERHIAGFTIFSDWSARDLQLREMRQLLGPAKGKDSATTMGPMLVTPDELAPFRRDKGYDLKMTAAVNGVPYSSGNWASLYWSFAQMIAYASRGTRLVAGDVIGSGTVGTGCILELGRVHGEDRFPYLQPGDVVTIEVEQLGRIENTVHAGSPVLSLG
jgi:2-keto-4-pentenoate hydratase/2-oxohepta-3-ene-1,7-dioic acid hydratase in catechol pathway